MAQARKVVRSVFADNYVQGSHRARYTPRVNRPLRPRVIAWAGPAAFYQTRFGTYQALTYITLHFLDGLSETNGTKLV